MSAPEFVYREDCQIAMPPNMPPKLLITFCKLQKSFWYTFMKEVEEYYAEELEEKHVEPVEEKEVEEKHVEPVEEKEVEEKHVEEVEEKHVEEVEEKRVEEKPKKKRTNKKKTNDKEPPVEKKRRGPSEYNLFISSEVERLRSETPDLNHKVAFAMAVAAWKNKKVDKKPSERIENMDKGPLIDPQNVSLEEVC